MVFQAPVLFDWRTVQKNVELPLEIIGRSKAEREAKASEMEHAIRKHCTVHHDEDPAFYKKLSEKVDALIERHL